MSVSELTLNRIKNVIRTDLQFDRGCRERGIEIAVCDFRNSLSVDFSDFVCRENRAEEEQEERFPDFRKHGALCDYTADLNWPDGMQETLMVHGELYEFGYVYSNELHVEHGWMKKSG